MATPFMSLSLPVLSQTLGPNWASLLNAALLDVDKHNHVSGSGVPIPTAGINIDGDLPLNGYNLISLRSMRLQANPSPLALATDLGCLYVSGQDLYFNDELGNQVRITSSGGLAGTPGSISGLSSPAAAAYNSTAKKFSWTTASTAYAAMENGAVTIHDTNAAAAFGITIQSPAGIAAAYSMTLPAALPSATKILSLSSVGAIAALIDADGSTLEIVTNSLRIKDSGVTGVKLNANVVDNSSLQLSSSQLSIKALGVATGHLAASAVTSAKLAAGAIDNNNKFNGRVVAGTNIVEGDITWDLIAANSITNAHLQTGAVTGAKLGYDVFPPQGLLRVSAAGARLAYGGPYTLNVSRTGTGVYQITGGAFTANSVVVANAVYAAGTAERHAAVAPYSGGCYVATYNGTSLSDADFTFAVLLW